MDPSFGFFRKRAWLVGLLWRVPISSYFSADEIIDYFTYYRHPLSLPISFRKRLWR